MQEVLTTLAFPEQLPALTDLPPVTTILNGAGKAPLIRGNATAQRAWLNAPASLADMLEPFTAAPTRHHAPTTPSPRQPEPQCDLCIRFDGCTHGNPGPAGIGIACFLPDNLRDPVATYSLPVTLHGKPVHATINLTEILAAIHALCLASTLVDQMPAPRDILVQGDSLNCIRWITGEYRLNEETLAPFVGFAQALLQSLRPCGVRMDHLRRDLNAVADDLGKLALGLAPEGLQTWVLRMPATENQGFRGVGQRLSVATC